MNLRNGARLRLSVLTGILLVAALLFWLWPRGHPERAGRTPGDSLLLGKRPGAAAVDQSAPGSLTNAAVEKFLHDSRESPGALLIAFYLTKNKNYLLRSWEAARSAETALSVAICLDEPWRTDAVNLLLADPEHNGFGHLLSITSSIRRCLRKSGGGQTVQESSINEPTHKGGRGLVGTKGETFVKFESLKEVFDLVPMAIDGGVEGRRLLRDGLISAAGNGHVCHAGLAQGGSESLAVKTFVPHKMKSGQPREQAACGGLIVVIAGGQNQIAKHACFIRRRHHFGGPPSAGKPDGFSRPLRGGSLQPVLVQLDITPVDKAQRSFGMGGKPPEQSLP
jgi:hypothetical protein